MFYREQIDEQHYGMDIINNILKIDVHSSNQSDLNYFEEALDLIHG